MSRYVSQYGTARMGSEEKMSRREKVCLTRLLVSAGVLFLAVVMKLTAPTLLAEIGTFVREPFSREIEFHEVAEAFGYLASGEGDNAESWQRVCRAVLAPSGEATAVSAATELDAKPCYTEINTPSRTRLTQSVLGYAYQTPLAGTLTSGYGLRENPTGGGEEFHYGLDIAAAEGTEITAFADGTVRASGDSNSYGKYIIIDHVNGTASLYAHLSRADVQVGDAVTMGEPIAAVGQTGNATGPHLHFELQQGGAFVNPIYYVEAE